MSARLISRGWLRREIEVHLPDGRHLVEYDGSRLGYEQVLIDGSIIRSVSLFWFVPRFEFKLGGWPSMIDVQVWPWFTLRSLTVRVGDRVVYAEGEGNKKPVPSDWADLA